MVAEPPLDEVVAGHRANFERIRTLRATFTVRSSMSDKPVLDISATYLTDLGGNLVRQGEAGKKLTEHSYNGGEVRRVVRTWPAKADRPPTVAADRIQAVGYMTDLNLLATLGKEFYGNDLLQHDLATVLAESDPPATAARDTRDGRPLVKVTRHAKPVKGDPYRMSYWFDPARGYTLTRVEADGTSKTTIVLSGHTELAGGVWLPTRSEMEVRFPPGVIRAVTEATQVVANEPLPDGGAALLLPPGTTVRDQVRSSEYQANPDWTPVGSEKRWQMEQVAVPAPPPPTQREPAGLSGWVLAAAVLVAGVAGLVFRRVRGRT